MSGSNIAVLGIGAIGGSVAADLSDLGRHEIQLCSRTRFDRLEVDREGETSRVRAEVLTDPAEASPADWILLATKAHQSASAAVWFERLCAPGSVVAVLQNGVDHEERIAPLLPADIPVLPVVVQLPAEKHAPGRIEQIRPGMLIVPDTDTGQRFAKLFDGGRTAIKLSDQFISQAWWKLLNNAALGGVCALALRENAVANDPEVRAWVLALMAEIMVVARAEGATLPDDAPEKALAMVLGAAPDHWSSITVDRREGRKLEWEVRNAVVGKRARRHGIATPLNDFVTTLLRVSDGGLA